MWVCVCPRAKKLGTFFQSNQINSTIIRRNVFKLLSTHIDRTNANKWKCIKQKRNMSRVFMKSLCMAQSLLLDNSAHAGFFFVSFLLKVYIIIFWMCHFGFTTPKSNILFANKRQLKWIAARNTHIYLSGDKQTKKNRKREIKSQSINGQLSFDHSLMCDERKLENGF